MAVLDFGAGNGMIGELLDEIGFGRIVGVDLLPEARAAALRDRPGVYEDYRVLDLTAVHPVERVMLVRHEFDCLACVAALGFGDVPQLAFAEAFNLVRDPGWLVFNLRDRILDGDEPGQLRCARGADARRGRHRGAHPHALHAPRVDRGRAAGVRRDGRDQAARPAAGLGLTRPSAGGPKLAAETWTLVH